MEECWMSGKQWMWDEQVCVTEEEADAMREAQCIADGG